MSTVGSSSSSGVGLVRGFLGSSLSKAQSAYEFNSPAHLSKKQLRKQQLRDRKLKRNHKSSHPSSSSASNTSLSIDGGFGINGHLNPIEFECTGDQVSTLIEQLRIKYKPLNQKPLVNNININNTNNNSKKKQKKKKRKFLLLQQQQQESSASSSKELLISDGVGVENESDELSINDLAHDIDNIELDGKSDDNSSLIIHPANSKKEKRKRRREVARLKKIQELQKLQEEKREIGKNKLHQFVKIKNSNLSSKKKMKDNNMTVVESSSASKNGSVLNNSTSTSGGIPSTSSNSSIPQLASPKVVLYPREKVELGWKVKLPPGSGLNNLGNSCYLNATLQALFHTPAFVNWLLRDTEHREKCNRGVHYLHNCTVCAMHLTLKELYNTSSSSSSFRPYLIHNKLRVICKHFTPGRQEDAHEFLRYLLESMERSYLTVLNCLRIDNRSKETTPLGQIFGGYLRTEVTCYNCDFVSTTFQPLAELQLDIRQVNSLEDALNNHFRKERLDNNDYKCEKCLKISQATKQFSLEIPPQVLCLQLKRFTLYGNKLSKQIHCNRSINLTKYLHKSKSNSYTSDVKYRLVAMITHIGSSPNCGHYTSIAEAANGNFYQYDDSYVHSISLQTALNSDAYVLIYEMEKGSCQTQNLQQQHVKAPNSNGIMIKNKMTNSNSTISPSTSLSNGTNKSSATNSELKSSSIPNGDHLHNLFATKSPTHLNKSWSDHSSLKNSISSNSSNNKTGGGGMNMKSPSSNNQNKKFQLVNSKSSMGGLGNGHSALKSAIITDPPLSPVKKNILSNGNSSNLLSSTKLHISSSTPNLSMNCPSLLSPTKTTPAFVNHNTCNGLNINRFPNQSNSNSNLSSVFAKSKLKSKSPEPEPKLKIPICNSPTIASTHSSTINTSAKDNDKSVEDTTTDTRSPFKSNKKRSRSSSPTSSTDSEPLSKRNKKEKKKHRKREKERNGDYSNRKRNEKGELSSSTKSRHRSDDEEDDYEKEKPRTFIASKTKNFIKKLFTSSNESRKDDKERLLTTESPDDASADEEDRRSRKDGYNNSDRRRKDSSGERNRSRSREKKRMNGESHNHHHNHHNGSRNRSKDEKTSSFDPSKINPLRRVHSWGQSSSYLSKAIDYENNRTTEKTREEIEDEEIDRGKVSKRFRSTSSSKSSDNDRRNGGGNKFQNYEDRKNSVKKWNGISNGYSSSYGNNYYDRAHWGHNGNSSSRREEVGVRRSHVFNVKNKFNSSSRF